MSKIRCYVARKDCGCIVAAFPVLMDKAIKGKILEQLAKAGLDIEQTSDWDVRENFYLSCDHNRPPLFEFIDHVTNDSNDEIEDDGIDQGDVDSMSEDITPEAEEELEFIEDQEETQLHEQG